MAGERAHASGRTLNIRGAQSTGVTLKVARSLQSHIKKVFKDQGSSVKLTGMRFIPSTKVALGQGSFEIMANTIVEVPRRTGSGTRAESIDSVITVVAGAKGMELQSVDSPALKSSRHLQRATGDEGHAVSA